MLESITREKKHKKESGYVAVWGEPNVYTKPPSPGILLNGYKIQYI